jgi:hypothetical protein
MDAKKSRSTMQGSFVTHALFKVSLLEYDMSSPEDRRL